MTERMQRLLDVFRSAQADVDASRKRLRDASAARLDELLKLPPAGRVQALRDPALTAFDRASLERSIEDALPKRTVRLPRLPRRWSLSARSLGWFGWRHRQGLLRTMVAVGPVAFFAVSARMHTPPRGALPVVFAIPLNVQWTMPDGSVSAAVDDPAGTQAVWYKTGSRTDLRMWFSGRGYGTLERVPDRFFTEGAIVQRYTSPSKD